MKNRIGKRRSGSGQTPPFPFPAPRPPKGFTLVELIMVMVVIGILAAVAAPRFFDNSVFQQRGFSDQVKASLRYAQKAAIARRKFVCVGFAGNSLTLTTGATNACGTALQSPSGDPDYTVTAPSGVSFTATPTAFSFNALGVPTSAPQVIRIADTTITIEAETGYVH